MLVAILGCLAALVLLTGGAELLVRGASRIALAAGLSPFFIGLTIVGFGTSTPELFASVSASLKGTGGIAVGNVVGSNIFNIGVILSVCALLCPIPVHVSLVRRQAWRVIAVSAVPYVALANGQQIGRVLGITMVALLAVLVVRDYRAQRRTLAPIEQDNRTTDRSLGAKTAAMNVLFVLCGLGLLVVGGAMLVETAATIARSVGVSDLVIGLTVVAAGTSAPELATSVVAALRKQTDIAVGNVLGSNVFNVLGVLGASAAMTPQTFSTQTLAMDMPVLLLLSVALIPIATSHARISRPEAWVLLGTFLAYMVALFTIAPVWFG